MIDDLTDSTGRHSMGVQKLTALKCEKRIYDRSRNGDFGQSYGQISASVSVEGQADMRDVAVALPEVAVSA